ncbi:hypothetical protein BH23ACT3_BH23ACT3_07390 [soil metagenome]
MGTPKRRCVPALAFLAEAAARTGHVDAARAVIPELEPFAGRFW